MQQEPRPPSQGADPSPFVFLDDTPVPGRVVRDLASVYLSQEPKDVATRVSNDLALLRNKITGMLESHGKDDEAIVSLRERIVQEVSCFKECVRACKHASTLAWERSCVHLFVCVCGNVFEYVQAYIHAHARIHICIHP